MDIIKHLSNKAQLKTEYIEKRLKVHQSDELKLLYIENLAKENNVKMVKIYNAINCYFFADVNIFGR